MDRQLNWRALVLLLISICMAQATSVSRKYSMVDPERNITGTVGAELTAVSNVDCSGMCLNNDKCDKYQYKETGTRNCILIHNSCGDADGQIFEQGENSAIYKKVGWVPPPKWTGPDAAFYQSFDDSDGLILREGTLQKNAAPLVSGQVNCALSLNRSQSQWVDLGIHTEACMTRPPACGAAGGAISVWINLIDCSSDLDGIISSYQRDRARSAFYCVSGSIGVEIINHKGYFDLRSPSPSGWTHVVLNYIGPEDGQGIRMFYDGTEVANDTSPCCTPQEAGDGRILVGRPILDVDEYYSNVQLDDLIYFNRALTMEEIKALGSVV